MISLRLADNKLLLFFPFKEELLLKAKSIPTGRWNKIQKAWEYAVNLKVYELLKKEFKVVNEEMEKLIIKKKVKMSSYQPKTPLYSHQLDAVKFAFEKFGFEVTEDE